MFSTIISGLVSYKVWYVIKFGTLIYCVLLIVARNLAPSYTIEQIQLAICNPVLEV